ncbi:hypothetical protein D3C74_411400 [compost metagenome]
MDGDFNGADDSGLEVELADLTGKGYLAADTVLPSTKTALTVATVEFDGDGKLVKVTLKTSETDEKPLLADDILKGKADR